MSHYESGEIVLVEFPFTSGESAKRRKDWKSADLLRESIVCVHKLAITDFRSALEVNPTFNDAKMALSSIRVQP